MTPRQQRMLFVGIIVAGMSIATTLVLLAINENMLYFYTPSDIKAGKHPVDRKIRVGGLVVKGSVNRATDGVTVQFDLTDTKETVSVNYTGILPDLFREGQGIIAIGQFHAEGHIVAEEVLAKHDENYMPPEVADALKEMGEDSNIEIPHNY